MDILSIKNIYLNLTCEDRDDALKQMSKKIVDLGYAKDSNKVFDYFIERENQISTGLENGFAIPHAKGTGISQAGIFFVRFTKPLEWESLDDSKITDAIFFCIPENGGSEYLQKLALIAQALSSKEFRDKIKSENKEANILAMLNNALIEEEKNTKDKKANSDKTIVAVVACPAGLAHTYMAKKALEVAAEKLNINAFVEAHGAMGIENKIPNSKINSADVVILATDVAVDTEGRFDSLETYQCSTNDVIKNAESVIKNAMALTNGKVKKANTQSDTDFDLQNTEIKGKNKFTRFMKWWGRDTMKHLMTSIGYLIPLAIAASVLIGISRVCATISGYDDMWAVVNTGDSDWVKNLNGWTGFLFSLEYVGTNFGLATLFIPFICAFICYSMNGKAGLAPGFLVGFVCGLRQEGFVGAMVCGLITGYIIKFVIRFMKIKGSWASITPILLVPVIGTFGGSMIAWWVLGYPFYELNVALSNGLTKLTENEVGAPLIAAVVAAMIAFDLGGPVNKAAYGISLGIFNTPEMSEIARFTPNTAVQLSIILPPLSLGLASIIGKKYYDDDIKESGKAAFIMGLVGVSEGAIPFAIKNPIRVTILNVIGCVCAAVFAVALGSLQEVNLSAFYSWGFPTKPVFYILAVLIGVLLICVPNVLFQKIYFHKKTNTKFKFFNPKTGFINFGIAISNMFHKKANRKQYLENEVDKYLRENGVTDLKAVYETPSSKAKMARLKAKQERKQAKSKTA